MPTNENKVTGAAPENSLSGEIGIREMTGELVLKQKRDEFMKEFQIDLSRGSDGPRISMKVHGVSAIEFLQRLREVLPDVEKRDSMVDLALGALKKNPALNEKIESARIETAIGRTDAEWEKYRDSQLTHGIGGREISMRDLFIVSGARRLFEGDQVAAPEPRAPHVFTRADKWIAELRRDQETS